MHDIDRVLFEITGETYEPGETYGESEVFGEEATYETYGEVSDQYSETLRNIRAELNLSFTDPQDPGLHRRRQRLRSLFASIPPARTRQLYAQLGERPTGDDLSRLFHGRLATATRVELLGILQRNFPPTPTPPTQTAPPKFVFVSQHEPLPSSELHRFQAALVSIRGRIAASGDPRSWRYQCWFEKLTAGGDDRVITWSAICPRTTGALGAAYMVGPCNIAGPSAVDQADLQNAIKSVADVESAARSLSFITHIRPELVWIVELTSGQFHLENFRSFHDDVQDAIVKLDMWANNPMGGSSMMPPAYRAIKEWIRRQQGNPNSVYSCL